MTDTPAPHRPSRGTGRKLRRVHGGARFAGLRAIMALLLRQMSTSYGRSPGGYLWAVLEPAAGIIFLTAIFSAGFRNPPMGTNFAIFYASGFMPFYMYMKSESAVRGALQGSKSLLSFPRVTIVDAIVARYLLEVLTQLLITYIILTAVLTFYDTQTVLRVGPIIMAFLMAAALGLGVGTVNCYLCTRYPVWKTFWGILTRPLVLISGVIFLPERLPDPFRDWLMWNPLMHVTGEARRGFYISYQAHYVDPVYVFVIAGVTLALGALLLPPYYRHILER